MDCKRCTNDVEAHPPLQHASASRDSHLLPLTTDAVTASHHRTSSTLSASTQLSEPRQPLITSAENITYHGRSVCVQHNWKVVNEFWCVFTGEVERGPRRKRSNFGGNADSVVGCWIIRYYLPLGHEARTDTQLRSPGGSSSADRFKRGRL